MKSLRYFLPVLLLIVSCTGNTIYKKPKNLIPKDTMVILLSDMHIASAARYTLNKFNRKNINYMPYIYEKYQIDSTRFETSNIYYSSRIDEYDELLKAIKKRLQDKSAEVQKEINASDSIDKGLKIEIKSEIEEQIKVQMEAEKNLIAPVKDSVSNKEEE